jgi:hypothetical protein
MSDNLSEFNRGVVVVNTSVSIRAFCNVIEFYYFPFVSLNDESGTFVDIDPKFQR